MKDDRKFIITKDNYKGYFKLFESRKATGSDREMFVWEALIYGIIGVIIGGFFMYALFDFAISTFCCSILSVVFTACSVNWEGLMNSSRLKLIYKSIQEEYPYVNIKISNFSLTKALADAKVIQRKRYTGDFEFEMSEYDSNILEYENYLKAEEIKEEYFQETKYKGYVVNPNISQEELEKVKTKIKSMVR